MVTPLNQCNIVQNLCSSAANNARKAGFCLLQATRAISAKFKSTNQSSMSTLVRKHLILFENGHASEVMQHWLAFAQPIWLRERQFFGCCKSHTQFQLSSIEPINQACQN